MFNYNRLMRIMNMEDEDQEKERKLKEERLALKVGSAVGTKPLEESKVNEDL